MEPLVAAHSGLRWLVLIGLVAMVVVGFMRSSSERSLSDRWLQWVALVFDIQVTIGIILYLFDQGWEEGGFIAVFHPIAMLAALAVFHIGLSRGRTQGGDGGWRTVGTMTLISLVLVIAAIPWQRGLI